MRIEHDICFEFAKENRMQNEVPNCKINRLIFAGKLMIHMVLWSMGCCM